MLFHVQVIELHLIIQPTRYALCLFTDTQVDDGRRRRDPISTCCWRNVIIYKNTFHLRFSQFKFIHRNRVVVSSFVPFDEHICVGDVSSMEIHC